MLLAEGSSIFKNPASIGSYAKSVPQKGKGFTLSRMSKSSFNPGSAGGFGFFVFWAGFTFLS